MGREEGLGARGLDWGAARRLPGETGPLAGGRGEWNARAGCWKRGYRRRDACAPGSVGGEGEGGGGGGAFAED